jgi:pyridoxal phosphate enzyme (YggS family)
MDGIAGNLSLVRKQIDAYAARAGRGPGEVRLIAATKTRTPEEINEAIRAGLTDIGENRAQEIVEKFDAVAPVRWHMIGHLQRNKVKYVIDRVGMIHSVDSLRLAEEIDRRAGERGRAMDILLQINAAGEESKSGIDPAEAEGLVRAILDKCENIHVCGFMGVAPAAEDPEDVRMYFRQVKSIFDACGKLSHRRLDLRYLSMGMSHDFGAAILEGANMVRIGAAIFGARRL